MSHEECLQGRQSIQVLLVHASHDRRNLMMHQRSQINNLVLLVSQAYFYPMEEAQLSGVSEAIRSELARAISSNVQTTLDPHTACIFVHLVSTKNERANFSSLPHWNGDGANHVIVIFDNCTKRNCDSEVPDAFGRAIVARQSFEANKFRRGFDIVLPVSLQSCFCPLMWSSLRCPMCSVCDEYGSSYFRDRDKIKIDESVI